MKSHLQKILVAMICLLAVVTARAADEHDFEIDGIHYHGSLDNLTCMVTACSDMDVKEITIPSVVTCNIEGHTLNGITFRVTSIDSNVFAYRTSLTSVSIGDNVKSIGYFAFKNCSSLEAIVIPDNVTNINMGAFEECTSLSYVHIGKGLTSIGSSVFSICNALTQAEVGNLLSLKTATEYSFSTIVITENYADGTTATRSDSHDINASLERIIAKIKNPIDLNGFAFSDDQYKAIDVIVPTESLTEYQAADVWKNFWNISGGAESYMSGISNVTIDKANVPDAIYDMNGRKLKAPQRGLNIINGKKVVVR